MTKQNFELLYRLLPAWLFWWLPALHWLDLRDNLLLSLPPSLAHHPKLQVYLARCVCIKAGEQVILLDNNLFTEVPPVLSSLPRLSVLTMQGLVRCHH